MAKYEPLAAQPPGVMDGAGCLRRHLADRGDNLLNRHVPRSGRASDCIQGRLPRYVAAAGYSFRSLRRLYRRPDLERHRSFELALVTHPPRHLRLDLIHHISVRPRIARRRGHPHEFSSPRYCFSASKYSASASHRCFNARRSVLTLIEASAQQDSEATRSGPVVTRSSITRQLTAPRTAINDACPASPPQNSQTLLRS
jgi:hypothetical protein